MYTSRSSSSCLDTYMKDLCRRHPTTSRLLADRPQQPCKTGCRPLARLRHNALVKNLKRYKRMRGFRCPLSRLGTKFSRNEYLKSVVFPVQRILSNDPAVSAAFAAAAAADLAAANAASAPPERALPNWLICRFSTGKVLAVLAGKYRRSFSSAPRSGTARQAWISLFN